MSRFYKTADFNKGGDKKNEKTMIYSIDSTLVEGEWWSLPPFLATSTKKLKRLRISEG